MDDIHNIWNSLTTSDNETPGYYDTNQLMTDIRDTSRVVELIMQSTPTTISATSDLIMPSTPAAVSITGAVPAVTYAVLIDDIKNLLDSIANDIESESHIFYETDRYTIEDAIHRLRDQLLNMKDSISVMRQKDHNE